MQQAYGHVWDKQATVRWRIDAAFCATLRPTAASVLCTRHPRLPCGAFVFMWIAVCQQIDTWTSDTFFDFDRWRQRRTGGPMQNKCLRTQITWNEQNKKTHTKMREKKENRKTKTETTAIYQKVDNLCIHITPNKQCICIFISLNRSIRRIHVYTRRHALFLASRRPHRGAEMVIASCTHTRETGAKQQVNQRQNNQI